MAERYFSLFNSCGGNPQVYLGIKDEDTAVRFEATYYEGKWQMGSIEYHYRAKYDENSSSNQHRCGLFGDDSCNMGYTVTLLHTLSDERCLKALVEEGSDKVFEILEEIWEKDHETNT